MGIGYVASKVKMDTNGEDIIEGSTINLWLERFSFDDKMV